LAIGVSVQWVEMPAEAIRDVQGEGVIAAGEDPEQLAFDLNAYLLLANAQYVALQGPDSHRAREAGDSHASRGGPAPDRTARTIDSREVGYYPGSSKSRGVDI
jgi:hypothetical protein